MSTIEQIPTGGFSNEGYPYIDGIPVRPADVNSVYADEARRVTENTGGSYLDYIAGRFASQLETAESTLPPTPVEESPHTDEMIACYRGYLRAVLDNDPRVDKLAPADVQRWFMDYNARIEDQ